MRLLYFDDTDDRIKLTGDLLSAIPPYTILSHTWLDDAEELTFQDLVAGAGTQKVGYQKLVFTAEQTQKDGLKYFWVDTCCIDKTSSAVLSEAINSMFRYYQKAVKCYVYLQDVSIDRTISDQVEQEREWKKSFRESRWFTRGWTLQELVAPSVVEFFSKEGVRLSDRVQLEKEINGVTGVSVEALRGSPLAGFSVEERMAWAEKRTTKREEDMAYSLLGIFDVNFVPLYGEGRNKAFRRLRREIRDAPDRQVPWMDVLETGDSLSIGSHLISRDNRYQFALEENGNLVLSGSNEILWASNTAGYKDVQEVILQHNGNMVMYNKRRQVIWSTQTEDRPRARLTVQNDGNVVLYSDNVAYWATHTFGGKVPEALEHGQTLLQGQSLLSRDNRYRLALRPDGNLIYTGPSGILWTSKTSGHPDAHHVSMEQSGSLAIYTADRQLIWTTNTSQWATQWTRIKVQDDGNAVIYSDRNAIWASHTCDGKLPESIEHGQSLFPGEMLVSRNNKYRLVMQEDRNLVVRSPFKVIWTSKTAGQMDIKHVIMQMDGNLVMYNDISRAVWASQTSRSKQTKTRLHMRNDGDLAIFYDEKIIWRSGSKEG
ncbi:HET-domain-containing protein [Pyrenochaeta sp. DS3sAY3a]|nr:HET-domain-containing protein [Pyrenochaeta sp. DS3sAY3a]